MKCVRCGHNAGNDGFCTGCGFDNKHIKKARNTADYYYNLGLEKAGLRDLSGAAAHLEQALTYNKEHKDARNLLGLVYYEMGEAGKAYIQWKISSRLVNTEQNLADDYIRQMEEHPAVFESINESAKKFNLALSYARQGSDDLAMIQIKKVLTLTPNFVRGHLLFALLHMRAGDKSAAKKDLFNALAIDNHNTTALRYLSELGERPKNAPELISEEKLKPENDNLKNVRPVDHYEDPNREQWKQFVYMLIGLAIGVVAMFVLVIPSVKAGVSVDYNNLKKQYNKTVSEKDSEISGLQEDKASLESENNDLKTSLSVYEGSNGEDSMYDSLLKATQQFAIPNYVECAKYLAKIKKKDLPSSTSQNMYSEMKGTAYPAAANNLYDSGMEKYNKYQYEEALKDFKQSYKYSDKNYTTLYQLAMCYKRTGDTDKAQGYFFDIINNSGDEDLIRKASNYGLDMTINEGKQAAAAAAGNTAASTEAAQETSEEGGQ